MVQTKTLPLRFCLQRWAIKKQKISPQLPLFKKHTSHRILSGSSLPACCTLGKHIIHSSSQTHPPLPRSTSARSSHNILRRSPGYQWETALYPLCATTSLDNMFTRVCWCVPTWRPLQQGWLGVIMTLKAYGGEREEEKKRQKMMSPFRKGQVTLHLQLEACRATHLEAESVGLHSIYKQICKWGLASCSVCCVLTLPRALPSCHPDTLDGQAKRFCQGGSPSPAQPPVEPREICFNKFTPNSVLLNYYFILLIVILWCDHIFWPKKCPNIW